MVGVVIQGISLGLSTGLFCLAYCAPIFVPFMISDKRGIKQGARIVAEMALGRLVAYLAFGVAIGYIGMKLEGPFLQRVAGIAMVVLSAILLLYVATKKWPHQPLCRWVSRRYFRLPIIFGFFTGINICPPFLLAISYTFGLRSMAKGMLLFGGFFLGTSLYLTLLLPLGYLGWWQNLRLIALMTALLSGAFFFVMGLIHLVG
jgi:sulfite exporter TauE/SafE